MRLRQKYFTINNMYAVEQAPHEVILSDAHWAAEPLRRPEVAFGPGFIDFNCNILGFDRAAPRIARLYQKALRAGVVTPVPEQAELPLLTDDFSFLRVVMDSVVIKKKLGRLSGRVVCTPDEFDQYAGEMIQPALYGGLTPLLIDADPGSCHMKVASRSTDYYVNSPSNHQFSGVTSHQAANGIPREYPEDLTPWRVGTVYGNASAQYQIVKADMVRTSGAKKVRTSSIRRFYLPDMVRLPVTLSPS